MQFNTVTLHECLTGGNWAFKRDFYGFLLEFFNEKSDGGCAFVEDRGVLLAYMMQRFRGSVNPAIVKAEIDSLQQPAQTTETLSKGVYVYHFYVEMLKYPNTNWDGLCELDTPLLTAESYDVLRQYLSNQFECDIDAFKITSLSFLGVKETNYTVAEPKS